MPIDPWSNQELVYRRTERGFKVYSVWDNMRDDGGVDCSLQSGGLGDLAVVVGGS